MYVSNFPRLAAALCCSVAMAAAFGEPSSRELEQIRRLRMQVQELQQEQTAQQDAAQRAAAEKAEAKAKLDAAQAELRRTRSAAGAQAQSLGELQKELDALREERNALQAQAAELQAELQASTRSVQALRTTSAEQQRALARHEAAYADLDARHTTQARGLQTCIANNQALNEVGQELLQRYAGKGVGEVLAQNEPFLQFKRVALENLMQGYQDRLDQAALEPLPGAATGAGVPAGGARP
jgi:chromosome segregation ATPase